MLFSSRAHWAPAQESAERVSFKGDANTATTAGVDLNNPDHDMDAKKEAHCGRDVVGITGITALALLLVAMQLL